MISSNSFQFERLKELRSWLYREVKIANYPSVLDIGAGDLRISSEIARRVRGNVHALDIVTPGEIPDDVIFTRGDANKLPYEAGAFDAVAASFLFIWIKDAIVVLEEVKRVLKKGGILLILSEPQISERIDIPDTGFNSEIKNGLRQLGAQMDIERALKGGLERTGFNARLLKTGGRAAIDDRAEILEEIEFLFEKGLIDSRRREEITRNELSPQKREVMLPLIYGYASL